MSYITTSERETLRKALAVLGDILARSDNSASASATKAVIATLEQLPTKPAISTDVDLYTEQDVSGLTLEELKELKNVWSKAGSKIAYACTFIEETLGEKSPKKHGVYYNFESGALSISKDSWNGYMVVKWNDKSVCSITGYRGEIKFVPGAWVHIVDTYYTQALDAKQKREDERKQEELDRLRAQMSLG